MFHCPFAVACAMQCRTCHNNLWGKKISFTRGTVIILRPLSLRSDLREGRRIDTPDLMAPFLLSNASPTVAPACFAIPLAGHR